MSMVKHRESGFVVGIVGDHVHDRLQRHREP